MSRPLRASILAPTLVVGLVLLTTTFAAGCTYVDPPVLSMSATTSDEPYYTLSREDMYDELNKSAAGGTTTTAKSYSTEDTAAYLNKKVNEEFLKHFMAEKKIVVTDADSARAQQVASASGGGSAQPSPEQLKTQAQLIAIYRSLATSAYESKTVDKDKELLAFYETNKAQIETPASVCLHVIALQAGTGAAAPTEADFAAALAKATEVRTRLDTEQFETVADAETPPGAQGGSPGGDAGCIEAANLGDVQAQVEALPIGVISQPIRTERGGYYIVRVDRKLPASTPSFDDVKDQIEAEVSQEIGKRLLPAVAADVIKRTNVRIDPRFGKWDAAQFTVTQPPPAATPTMPSTTVAGLPLGPGATGPAGRTAGTPTTP